MYFRSAIAHIHVLVVFLLPRHANGLQPRYFGKLILFLRTQSMRSERLKLPQSRTTARVRNVFGQFYGKCCRYTPRRAIWFSFWQWCSACILIASLSKLIFFHQFATYGCHVCGNKCKEINAIMSTHKFHAKESYVICKFLLECLYIDWSSLVWAHLRTRICSNKCIYVLCWKQMHRHWEIHKRSF